MNASGKTGIGTGIFSVHQIDFESWEDLETEVSRLRSERAEVASLPESMAFSEFIFRGQRDDSLPLNTTLERRVSQEVSFSQYFKLVCLAKPQIETFTENRWEFDDWPELDKRSSDYDLKLSQFPAYDYLVFLRHHGFPSPLLDWTRSLYVAAYFSFAHAQSGRVAIFVYQEFAGHSKSGGSNSPQIWNFGPYVRSHSRHFLQQSEYTIACNFKDGCWWYAPHQDVFAGGLETQDRLWKFTIPASERSTVLRILEDHNLNAFSLFQTEESLLETIAFREIEIKGMDY